MIRTSASIDRGCWGLFVCAAAAAASVAFASAAQSPKTPGEVTVTRIATPEKALRFDVTVPAGVDDVWTAFTTSAGLSTWLWRDTRVELRPGGDWLAIYSPTASGGGSVISFVPRTELVLSAMAPEQFPTVRATRTRAVFTFAAESAKSTHVRLTQTGWKAGKEWDDAYVKGPLAWPKGR